jgi:hypothetical protein
MVLAIVIAIGFLAVHDGPASAQQASGQAGQPAELSLDGLMLEVATRNPDFGGAYFDRDGRLTLHVLQRGLAASDGFSRIARMSFAVESMFRNHASLEEAATKRIGVFPADYSFAELYQWHQAATAAVLGIPGVVLTDIAEDRNRIRIGVDKPEVAVDVRERLARLSIPSGAAIVELSTAMRPVASLRDKFRPLMGGIQVNVGPGNCTLGFLAVRARVTGMVTASHCTLTQGGVEYTMFHQPQFSAENRIGVEVRDPGYFSGGVCPSGRRCRYSDSAFVRIPHTGGPAAPTTRGSIARPVRLDSRTVGGGRFRITSENSTPLLNEVVGKVGRTTGWTQGRVIGTCVNTEVAGRDITLLCQDWVKAEVNRGDSGSPVFRITNSPASGDVRLYGVVWGGGSVPHFGTVFVFSSLGASNLQRSDEMGNLTTCASGFDC